MLCQCSSGGAHLLVLVGCDCGELGLREGEAVYALSRQRLDLGQIQPRVVADDVNPGLVLVHRLQDDLEEEVKKMFQMLLSF